MCSIEFSALKSHVITVAKNSKYFKNIFLKLKIFLKLIIIIWEVFLEEHIAEELITRIEI